MTMPKILGIPMFDRDIPAATAQVLAACRDGSPPRSLCVSATGAHGLVYAREHTEFAAVLREYYLNLPDGTPGVWLGRLKGAHGMRRCYGPDFFESVMRQTADDPGIRHFLAGGQPQVAEELRAACRDRFGNPNVVGCYTPPFRPLSDGELGQLARQIEDAKADIVWIGLSTPRQEILAARLARVTRTRFLVTVGAAFDFHTGRVPATPAWLQPLGLEWAYRLSREPRRLWRRYTEVVPKFLLYNLVELARGEFFDRAASPGADRTRRAP
jgi:N-acetylglucosaminyldiphosphoundecaprenol N-acetyl-beta-D-mannosaminyltransferase